MIYTDGLYLIADSHQELHAFITRAGLPRQRVNSASFFPHYRLGEGHLPFVLMAGARKISPNGLQRRARKVFNRHCVPLQS